MSAYTRDLEQTPHPNDVAAAAENVIKASFGPPPPPLKQYPAPYEFVRMALHALLILSVAKVELEKLIEEGAYNSHAIDKRDLLEAVGGLHEIGDKISCAFHKAADRVREENGR